MAYICRALLCKYVTDIENRDQAESHIDLQRADPMIYQMDGLGASQCSFSITMAESGLG